MKSVLNDKNIEENFFDALKYTWVDNERLYRSLCDIENRRNTIAGYTSTGVDYTAVNLAYMALTRKDEKIEYITRLMKDMILSELVEFTRNKNIHRKEYYGINEIGEQLNDEEIYNLLHDDYIDKIAEREVAYLLKETEVHNEVNVDRDVALTALNRVHLAILSAAHSFIEDNDLIVRMSLSSINKYDTFFKLGAFLGYSTEQLKEMLKTEFICKENYTGFNIVLDTLTVFDIICDDIVAFMNGSYKNDSKYSDLYKELSHYYNPAKGHIDFLTPEDLAGILSLITVTPELLESNFVVNNDKLSELRMNYMLSMNYISDILSLLDEFIEAKNGFKIGETTITYYELHNKHKDDIRDTLQMGWMMNSGLEG